MEKEKKKKKHGVTTIQSTQNALHVEEEGKQNE